VNDLNVRGINTDLPISALTADEDLHRHDIAWETVETFAGYLDNPRSWIHRFRVDVARHKGKLVILDGRLVALAYQRHGRERIPVRLYQDLPAEAWPGIRYRGTRNPSTRQTSWARAQLKKFEKWLKTWLRTRRSVPASAAQPR
jgi:hypothetical protein